MVMALIETEIVIEASVAQVWDVLMRADEWKDWNPSFPYVGTCRFREHEAFEIHVNLSNDDDDKKKRIVAHPVVTRLDADKRVLVWRSKVPCLFVGLHSFELFDDDDDDPRVAHDICCCTTRLVHREEMRGCAVPILKMTGQVEQTKTAFLRMNKALKARCEAAASSSPSSRGDV